MSATRITKDEIARAKELCASATPAPWLLSYTLGGVETTQLASNGDVYGGYLWAPDFSDETAQVQNAYLERDGEFFAASRALVPALLDEVERLRAALKEACAIADAHVFVPDVRSCVENAQEATFAWSGSFIMDWTLTFKDKDRVAELAKLADGAAGAAVTRVTLEGVELPEGWSVDAYHGTAIVRPGVGAVSIDFDRRVFRAGWTTSGRPIGATSKDRYAAAKKYRGRGWRAKIVRDAVAWLQSV